jgi:DNA-binding transcriptional regulator YbjK
VRLSTRRTGRRSQHDERDHVLAAALRLADEQGLEAATVHAVARCPHATLMALHRHGDDKKDAARRPG